MKKVLVLLILFGVFACKKKKDPVAEPEPVQTGQIVVSVQAYNSFGETLSNNSGIQVQLNASTTASTDASGKVVFENQPYGNYFPVLFGEGWEGPPSMINLSAASVTTSLPFAQRSTYKVQNFSANSVNKDSITISFNLDSPVPNGKMVKLAVISSTSSAMNSSNFESADVISTSTSAMQRINIAKLSKFKTYFSALDSTSTVYINAVPVSYGIYESNLTPKPVLLGETLFPPNYIIIKKNWK